MALCVYKRIRSDPIRLNLGGKSVIVHQGQLVVADNKDMMGISGFAFLKLYEQTDNIGANRPNLVINRPKPIIEHNLDEMTVQVQEIVQQEMKTQPVVVQEITPQAEKPVVFVEDKNRPVGFAKETINTLKSFDNKQWFALKKEDIIKFLEDANIEYQHISSDKWELLKFLKKIIKEL
jgi:hypothetical protein